VNPELPPLTWNDCWEGAIVLPAWSGFQTRRGPYAAVSSDDPSDGAATLRFDTDGAGKVPPTAAQIAAYGHLVEHEAEVAAAVLNAVFAEYPRFRDEYIDAYDDEDARTAAQTAPPFERPDQLKSVMGLYAVFVLSLPKDGVGYVGFEFGCVWEAEHGLGVLTHKNRVVEIGPAYTAFDGNRAEADADAADS
jgi:hypothetical protein